MRIPPSIRNAGNIEIHQQADSHGYSESTKLYGGSIDTNSEEQCYQDQNSIPRATVAYMSLSMWEKQSYVYQSDQGSGHLFDTDNDQDSQYTPLFHASRKRKIQHESCNDGDVNAHTSQANGLVEHKDKTVNPTQTKPDSETFGILCKPAKRPRHRTSADDSNSDGPQTQKLDEIGNGDHKNKYVNSNQETEHRATATSCCRLSKRPRVSPLSPEIVQKGERDRRQVGTATPSTANHTDTKRNRLPDPDIEKFLGDDALPPSVCGFFQSSRPTKPNCGELGRGLSGICSTQDHPASLSTLPESLPEYAGQSATAARVGHDLTSPEKSWGGALLTAEDFLAVDAMFSDGERQASGPASEGESLVLPDMEDENFGEDGEGDDVSVAL